MRSSTFVSPSYFVEFSLLDIACNLADRGDEWKVAREGGGGKRGHCETHEIQPVLVAKHNHEVNGDYQRDWKIMIMYSDYQMVSL